MAKEKIAIIIDSGTDVPQEVQAASNMYVLPLRIIYKDEEFIDGVNITPKEIYDRLATEIPSTSLPSGEDIIQQLEKIKAAGYNKVIAVTISSGLSGTYNFICNLATEVEGLEVAVIDTKNISIGSGFTAIQVAEDIKKGARSFDEIVARARKNIGNNKVFFTVSTLEYLQHGGRIGLVGATIGSILNIKPIISCNEDGVYYTVAKVRGRNKSLAKLQELARAAVPKGVAYNLGILDANAPEEVATFIDEIKGLFTHYTNLYTDTLSAALGVHTGPGLIGIGYQIIEE